MMMQSKSHIKIAFAYFLLAASLGVVLRAFQVFELPITYKFFVHTHSHIALLGWVYVALTTLIYRLFVQSPIKNKKYRKIFWFTQFTLVGMLLTFPFTGYALFSIIFSTLFLFASYWFFQFFSKHVKPEFRKNNSYKLLKAALWYMVVSSLGPWALGGIMNTLGAESVWYRMAIYFYLHFQYNGWMVLALVGLFFYVLKKNEVPISKKGFQRFFWSINLGILLTFFLSTLWTKPPLLFYILGGIGVVVQLFALLLLVRFLVPYKDKLKSMFTKFQWNLLHTAGLLLAVKIVLQSITTFPYFANLAATILDFTVGYLHLTFLGAVTIGLFLFLDYFRLLKIPRKAYLLYLTAFVASEALLFYKGIASWQKFSLFDGYFETLTLASALIPLSLFLILVVNLANKKQA